MPSLPDSLTRDEVDEPCDGGKGIKDNKKIHTRQSRGQWKGMFNFSVPGDSLDVPGLPKVASLVACEAALAHAESAGLDKVAATIRLRLARFAVEEV